MICPHCVVVSVLLSIPVVSSFYLWLRMRRLKKARLNGKVGGGSPYPGVREN